MNTFVWGAVVGGLICLLVGAAAVVGGLICLLVGAAAGGDDAECNVRVRTEWAVWFIILMIASGVSIYIYNYAGGGR